jgi:hypothetical protein
MAHSEPHAFNVNTAYFKSTANHTSRQEITEEEESKGRPGVMNQS